MGHWYVSISRAFLTQALQVSGGDIVNGVGELNGIFSDHLAYPNSSVSEDLVEGVSPTLIRPDFPSIREMSPVYKPKILSTTDEMDASPSPDDARSVDILQSSLTNTSKEGFDAEEARASETPSTPPTLRYPSPLEENSVQEVRELVEYVDWRLTCILAKRHIYWYGCD